MVITSIILLVLFLTELILSTNFNNFYFKYSIPLKKYQLKHIKLSSLSLTRLEEISDQTNWMPKTKLKFIDNKILISTRIFSGFSLLGFSKFSTPTLHGIIESDEVNQITTFKYYLNYWTLIVPIAVAVIMILNYLNAGYSLQTLIILIAIVLIVLPMSVIFMTIVQLSKYKKLRNFLSDLQD